MIFISEMICEGVVSAKWARDPFTPCQPEVIPLPFFANTNRHGLVAWQNFLSCAGLFLLDLLVGSLDISYTQLWISTIGCIIYPIVDLMHNCGYAQLLNLSPIQVWSSKRIHKIHLLLIHKYFSILICKQRM